MMTEPKFPRNCASSLKGQSTRLKRRSACYLTRHVDRPQSVWDRERCRIKCSPSLRKA